MRLSLVAVCLLVLVQVAMADDGGEPPEMKCTNSPCTIATQDSDCSKEQLCVNNKCCTKMEKDERDKEDQKPPMECSDSPCNLANDNCNSPAKCIKRDDSKDTGQCCFQAKNDDSWNSSCPAVPPLGDCQGPCPTCTGEICCSYDGCGHMCTPDLSRCGTVNEIFVQVMKSTTFGECVPDFIESVSANSLELFCSKFWGGLTCLAKHMAKDNYKSMCLKRMAMLLTLDKRSILDRIEALGETFNANHAKNVLNCQENPMKKPTDVRPTATPPVDKETCGKSTVIQKHLAKCKLPTGEVYSDEFCESFKKMVYCIAQNVYAAMAKKDTHKMMQCASQINEYIEEHASQLATTLATLRNFKPSRCMEKKNVCGKPDVKPLDKHDCSKRTCPTGYMCKDKYCCPQVNSGTCPERKGAPMCDKDKRCRMDSDCKSKEEKCCSQGCGYMTCTKSETKKHSACEKEFSDAVRQLRMSGLCGDGKGVLKMPCCQSGMFCPIQGDIQTGDMYCVTEDGKKIPGSDFRGNKNCPRVHAGTCPAPGAGCSASAVNLCTYDDECKADEKCCLAKKSDSCVKACVKADKAVDEPPKSCPSNQQPMCCPVTLCQAHVCMAERTAICRINPCGGCKVEFYDINGKKVDCDKGISKCTKERAMAQYMNAFMRMGDFERIRTFIEAHARQSGQEEDGDDDDDNMNGRMSTQGSDGSSGMDHDEDENVDEYGDRSRQYDKMEEDDDDDNEDTEDGETLEGMAKKSCEMFAKYDVCKNGGTCKIGVGESWFQLCECQKDFHGLFCETKGTLTPDTQCMRDQERVTAMQKVLASMTMPGNLVRSLLTRFRLPNNLLPKFSCDSAGKFNAIQAAAIVPLMKNSVLVQYCVNVDNGRRILNSPVMPASKTGSLDCAQKTKVDFFKLPMKCRYGKMVDCPADAPCQYYYNKMDGKCELGAATGHGFLTPTDCYDTCARLEKAVCPDTGGTTGICVEACGLACNKGQLCCSNGCGHMCMDGVNTYPDDLCQNRCDYTTQFCKVTTTGTTQLGECTDFPKHCLQDMDAGYGDKKIGAYFFHAAKRRCMKFMYRGKSGNRNRFYSLHQCQTECSTRSYKNPSVACPIPRALLSKDKMLSVINRCDNDNNCPGDDVCCSNGMARVCTPPVSSCSSGLRCSLDGACVEEECVCPECTNIPTSKVCGSDGKDYDNECLLRQEACKTFSGIRVVNCTDATTTGSDCTFPCTMEYMPVCGLVVTTTGGKTLETFSNLCLLKGVNECGKKKVHLLYKGKCSTTCGTTTCEEYEECVNDKCMCADVCTADYRPVCGYSIGAPDIHITFGNLCGMRAEACQKKQLYAIKSYGACKEMPEPEYECPTTKPDIPFSAVFRCRLSDNGYCNKKMEKCCPYGAGTRCMSKRVLMRNSMEKTGICPPLSYIDFKKSRCLEAHCEEDRDCVGDAKCCANIMCKSKTCVQPIVKEDTKVCKSGFKMLPMMCDPTVTGVSHECPGDTSYCAKVERDNLNFGLCCTDANKEVNMEDKKKIMVCHLLKALGKECQNGGTCKGDLKSGHLCTCPDGTYGTMCEKKIPAANCKGTVNCIKAPCTGAKCPLYPTATCTDNYCESCNALFSMTTATGLKEDVTAKCYDTPCWRKQMIMKMLKTILMPQEMEKDEEKEKDDDKDKSDDKDEDKDKDDDKDEDKDDMDDPIQQKIWEMVKMLGIALPADKNPICAADGHYEQIQCMMDMKTMKRSCVCVDQQTGMPLPDTPRRPSRVGMDCSASTTPNFPSYCRQVPTMGGSCGTTSTPRYYFDHGTGECKKFDDQGCDTTSNNIFDDEQTCMSTCNAASYMPKMCQDAKLNCEEGKECRVEEGKAKCKDIRTADASGVHYEPRCNTDGQYEPRQCQGDVCVCVNPLNGTEIPNTIGDGGNLGCSRKKNSDDVNVTRPDAKDQKKCRDGKTPKFCKNGGNPCKDCSKGESNGGNGMSNGDGGKKDNDESMRDNNQQTSQLDKDGRCRNCGACPTGQGQKKCKKTMCDADSVCKQFPNAVCRVNRCTCKEEYVALNNNVVNCNKVISKCKRQQFQAEVTRAAEKYSKASNGGQSQAQSQVPEIKCSANGGYEASCTGTTCSCLNAASGKAVGQAKSGVDINNIDCSKTQKQTQVRRIKGRLTVSKTKSPKDYNKRTLEKIVAKIIARAEELCECKIIDHIVKEGSTLLETTAENDPAANSEADLSTKWENFENEVNANGMTLTDTDGVPTTVSGAETIGTQTEEDLEDEGKPLDKDDDNKKTIIIVVVVVVAVVVLIACGVACYCYKKANASKAKDIPFDNLAGKDNPTYKV